MIHPVTDAKSHARALKRIHELMDADPATALGQELDALATLVDAYEKRTAPILPPSPIEAILARMEDLGWTRKDLEPLIGSRARVSEVLSRRRSLTLPMIRRIVAAMEIPADILVGASEARRPALARPRSRRTQRRSA